MICYDHNFSTLASYNGFYFPVPPVHEVSGLQVIPILILNTHHMATLKYNQKSFHKEILQTEYKYMRNSFLPEKLRRR